ncbi:MAG: hypothetical protein KBD94_07435 [Pyrinomonadaceae bacterium]|nr:hypothetical protein [Pyrinomonadaceae bacterium]
MRQGTFRLVLIAMLLTISVRAYAQPTNQATSISRDFVVEVTYNREKPAVYQQIGKWAWYGDFILTDDWRERMGERRIRVVKFVPREEAGIVKIKVTAIRGVNHEIEDLIGEYVLSEKGILVSELTSHGIVPIELKLVRAPATVAELPTTTSSAPSFLVGVEPAAANLPSFKATFLNASAKSVFGIAFRTSISGKTQTSAMPRGWRGNMLLEPGETYERVLLYPMQSTSGSTGEVSQSRVTDLHLDLQAVVFSDGTWEGQANQASQLRAFSLGEKIQLRRLLALLRSPSAASPTLFAVELERLTYKVDISEVGQLVSEFTGLPKGAREVLRIATQAASSGAYRDFKAAFESEVTGDPAAFPAWVKRETSRLQTWLDSLP